MTLQEALETLKAMEEAQAAYGQAFSVMYVDGDTVAPKMSYKGRAKALGYLSGELYSKTVNERNIEAIQTILDAGDAVDALTRRKATVQKEDLEDMLLMPKEEYQAYQETLTEAGAVWHEAKLKSDWAAFQPYLEKLVAYKRRFAERKDAGRPAYDVMLDRYEKGLNTKTLEGFFSLLRSELTPVILAVKDKPAPDDSCIHGHFPVEGQRELNRRVMAVMGLDPERTALGETEHPFTDGVNKWDVRITTHYHEDDVSQNLYSVIHEGGHALYELGVADELQFTCLSGGSAMSIHESQSRFYENLIGRSRPFMETLLPILRDVFPEQFRAVTVDQLYRAMNKAMPSLIRTEADELTYAMHVAIRFEIEKLMFSGDAKLSELPAIWNQLYHEYLGVTVPDHRRGILQDSHWSGGLFGYFPSYALGSAYGVQMLHAMERDVDVWGAVRAGDLTPVTAWLGEHIHRFGQSKTPAELLVSAEVNPFDPHVYVDYLKKKYGELYSL